MGRYQKLVARLNVNNLNLTLKNIYSFTEFTHFCICSFAFMYLLIYLSMNKFCKFYLIMNSQSNLFIDTKFVLYKFYVCLILHFCVCICVWVCYGVYLRMFVRVFVFICVLPVASVLAAFVLPPFWLYFSKTIRGIHLYCLPKNSCQREESFQSILSLESQTSFSCN